ncbi:MAG: hypothetical protein AB1397_02955, partial [bacterium]
IIKDSKGNYYIIESEKRRLIEGGLKEIQERGLGEKKEYDIKLNMRSLRKQFLGTIGLIVDGEMVKEWKTERGKEYEVRLPLSPGEHKIDVAILFVEKKIDMTTTDVLPLSSLQVGSNLYYPKEAIIDIGNAFDPTSYTDGQKIISSDVLREPGTFRFTIPFDPSLSLSDSEIENIPQAPPLYKDGTLVQRDENSPLYLIFKGERHLIENNLLTLKLYGLSAQNIRKIGELIDQIKGGDPLPKYPERTLIKDGNNTFYLIQENKRYKVPDNETLEAMGFFKNIKEREIIIWANQNLSEPSIIQLKINDKPVGEWKVITNHHELKEYKVKLPLQDGETKLTISCLKGSPLITNFEVDSKIYEIPVENLSDFVFSEGKSVNFDIVFDSAIELTKGEIDTIPYAGELPRQFREGSLIKDSKTNNSYLIAGGEKKAITQEYLSFYNTNPGRTEDLSQIEEGEALPKYPENSVLTDGINKYLYIQGKKLKFESLDELTKKGFSPEEGNVPIEVRLKNLPTKDTPMELWIDNKLIKEWIVSPNSPLVYNLSLPLSAKKHNVELIFPEGVRTKEEKRDHIMVPAHYFENVLKEKGYNPSWIEQFQFYPPGTVSPQFPVIEATICIPSAFVDYIKIGNQNIQPEEGKGVYDWVWGNRVFNYYKYSLYHDNQNLFPSSEKIPLTPGALRFKDIEIIPSINVSSNELAKIPDLVLAQSLPPESTSDVLP